MLPILYHTHHSLHMEDLPFWLDLVQQAGGPVLELGCGTGRLLLPLAKAGCQVCGLDREHSWLVFLRHHLPGSLNPAPQVFAADMANFHLARRFALILLPCNTLSALSSETRLAMLALACQHLSPGGLFAASLPNPAVLAGLPQQSDVEIEEILPHPVDGEPVQVSSAWQRSADQFTVTWYYDHLLPDGQVERFIAQVHHTLQPVGVYTDELHRAGLVVDTLYGDFNQSPYTENSPSLILLARKATWGLS